MSQEEKKQVEEIVKLMKNPSIEDTEKIRRLVNHPNDKIALAACAAVEAAALDGRAVEMDDLVRILDPRDLN